MTAARGPRAALSWSSGKDAAHALHACRRDGIADVVTLLTTVDAAQGDVPTHFAPGALPRAQAAAIGLPLATVALPTPCPNETYIAKLTEAATRLADQGITHIVFGDLFLEDIVAWRRALFANTPLTPLFPLMGTDTAALAREMIDLGVDARLISVDTTRLDAAFAGRRFDAALLADLPDGVDPCGENGEFHTAVLHSPDFSAPLRATLGATLRDGRYAHVPLRLAAT